MSAGMLDSQERKNEHMLDFLYRHQRWLVLSFVLSLGFVSLYSIIALYYILTTGALSAFYLLRLEVSAAFMWLFGVALALSDDW
jgi:hypothetical protein